MNDNLNISLCILPSVRIQSNGPTFRGFAVQAREFTESFAKGAKFVGAFVNPSHSGDWRIWNCAAVSYSYSILLDQLAI